MTHLGGADFWEGHVTKHFSVKKGMFSEKGGGAIQWIRGLVPSDTKLLLTKNCSEMIIFENLQISRVIP